MAEVQAGGTPLYSGACAMKLRWLGLLLKNSNLVLVETLRRTNFEPDACADSYRSGQAVRYCSPNPDSMRMYSRRSIASLVALAALLAGCGGGGGTTDPEGFTHKDGSLASGDDTLTSGEFADEFSVSAQPGQWIEVVMTSSEVDPYVILKPPSCPQTGTCEQQVDNDDVQSGDTRAFVFHNATEAGSWQIIATSSVAGEMGAYDVAYRVVDGGTAPATAGVQSAANGLNASGTLAAGDKTLQSGEYIDNYVFYGNAGQSVTIDLESSAFDPYLILFMPDKSQEDNDDFEGSQSHSRLEMALPQSGMYRLSATSYAPGDTGPYTLVMSAGGASAPAGGEEAVPFEK